MQGPSLDISPEQFELWVMDVLKEMVDAPLQYEVSHREVVPGIDGSYEIDIVIRFSSFGGEYTTLVECKRYSRPIEREKVQSLWAKVHSTSAQKGFLFSTSGFQSGAIEFAKAHGIALVSVADGRTSYFTRSLGDGQVTPWSHVPPGIPKVIGWLIEGNQMSLVTPDRVGPLRAYLSA